MVKLMTDRLACACLALMALLQFEGAATGQSPTTAKVPWIWSPQHQQGTVPTCSCYFRKAFQVRGAQSGYIEIAADDRYELYVNGRRVAVGQEWRNPERHELDRYLVDGMNVIAIKVTNDQNAYAGLMATVHIQTPRGTPFVFTTDKTWKTSLSPLPLWQVVQYNDWRWPVAAELKPVSPPDGTAPVGDMAASTQAPAHPDPLQKLEFHPVQGDRLDCPEDFIVEHLHCHAHTGSLVAMAFDEHGNLLVSREEGPLLSVRDSDGDGDVDQVHTVCDQVTNCHGILPLNGDIYVVGNGPEQVALYRLRDQDSDGKTDDVQALVQFEQAHNEHGPHGLALGPDGYLYVIVGNHAQPKKAYDPASPHQGYYEGDLIQPRYEDPGGHAVGIKAPGGVVLRTDLEGKKIEAFAGGLRNPYDLAFNRDGELFTHDADMESDIGASWYRPTRLLHVIAGGEYGWRSGWAKWPAYYIDSLPATVDTSRGSPTGAVFYDHVAFPIRFHGALFSADWSEGRIVVLRTEPDRSSYRAMSEVFLEGQPLNVTDLEVGPDGALYFVTGGRGTAGGVYRVVWKGTAPAMDDSRSIVAAVQQPQPQSAWGRQRIAAIQQQMASQWPLQLVAHCRDTSRPADERVTALGLMQLYGPRPTTELLIELADDQDPRVRAKATYAMGLTGDVAMRDPLVRLLQDPNGLVRRAACTALRRNGFTVDVALLDRLLATTDRHEAWSARRLLESLPAAEWHSRVMETSQVRLFLQLAIARLVTDPQKDAAIDIIARVSEFLNDYVNDRDFTDMLRVVQIALARGGVTREDLPTLGEILAEEFPTDNAMMNRELVRVLVYLQTTHIKDRFLAYLDSNIPPEDKMHLAAHLKFLQAPWTTEDKLHLLRTLQPPADKPDSIPPYVQNIGRDFAAMLNEEERGAVLAGASLYPGAALAVLYDMPEQLTAAQIEQLKSLDRLLVDVDNDSASRLRAGVIAVLSRSHEPSAVQYLRDVFDQDSERRPLITIGLAQQASSENFGYLIRGLSTLDRAATREVILKLGELPDKPQDAESYQAVIQAAIRLQDQGAEDAVKLLEKWIGLESTPNVSWQDGLQAWQNWYRKRFPQGPAIDIAQGSQGRSFDQLLGLVQQPPRDPQAVHRGATVFRKAQCAKCHRFGAQGESMGPDLSTVANRFSLKEILEAIVFPSKVISDQYASKTVVDSSGRSHTGIVGAGAANDWVVLKADGTKVRIAKSDVEEIVPSTISAMPEGLLDPLTPAEVADLFAYLRTPAVTPVTQRPGIRK